jgi:hypothetical protein
MLSVKIPLMCFWRLELKIDMVKALILNLYLHGE